MWYLTFTNSPRKHTVTYHFSDLQEVYSGNRQIHSKCQLQYIHPPLWQMSLCNNSSDNKSYWIHRVNVKVSALATTVINLKLDFLTSVSALRLAYEKQWYVMSRL